MIKNQKSPYIFEINKLNLWYDYGKKHALVDVDLQLPLRKVTSLIGPSGCGKSTFIRCLNKMNDLIVGVKTSGSIKFDQKYELINTSQGRNLNNLFGLINKFEPNFLEKKELVTQIKTLEISYKKASKDQKRLIKKQLIDLKALFKQKIKQANHERNLAIKQNKAKMEELHQEFKNQRLTKNNQDLIEIKENYHKKIDFLKKRIHRLKKSNTISPLELRTRVGMVFQKPNPFPMTIWDNVAYGPRSSGIKSQKELNKIVEKALKDAALWDEVKNNIYDDALGLSGGQQQRLCIARAIAMEPEVLLMDEPTSALDPIATNKIEKLMSQLKRKYTIVVVTHSMQQAARISDKTAFFYLGKLIEFDKTRLIFTKPRQRLTKDYIRGKMG